jgi:hypothetical protein
MIELLAIISFLAIAAYCLVVAWPHLRWSALTERHPAGLRPQHVSARHDRVARKLMPTASPDSFRQSNVTAGLYSRRSEEFVRRGVSARDALVRDLAGFEQKSNDRN